MCLCISGNGTKYVDSMMIVPRQWHFNAQSFLFVLCRKKGDCSLHKKITVKICSTDKSWVFRKIKRTIIECICSDFQSKYQRAKRWSKECCFHLQNVTKAITPLQNKTGFWGGSAWDIIWLWLFESFNWLRLLSVLHQTQTYCVGLAEVLNTFPVHIHNKIVIVATHDSWIF